MNTCKPQKISLLDNTNCLLPNDIIPVVQKGTNRTISAKNLIDLIINRIKDILPGSSEAMCIAVEAKKLAELASADATLALKNLANALAYATKAYQLACLMDARILALEGDHALIIELLDALALLTRQVNINTQRINDIINSNILKITTDADNNYTTYTFYVDNRKIGEIKVPKPKEYTGSQYIDINEERVISLTGLANVAFTGDYNDLSNRPTKLTDFYIDIDFLKDSDLEGIEDRITDLEECCEELHRKPNKLISKLIECENPFIDYNGDVRSLTYDVFIDINTVNDTEYVIPDSETWNDIILPNSTHTITIIISTPYWGRNLTLYNNGRHIPMSREYIGDDNTEKWSAKLTDIRGNVILTGKIFNRDADESDIEIIDINSGKELNSGVNDIGLMPGWSLLRENSMDVEVRPYDDNTIFDEYTDIAYLIPNTNWANLKYEGPSMLSLEITEAPSYGVIYISGIKEVPQSATVYHSINIKKLGLGNGTITGPTRVEDSSLYNATVTPDLNSIILNIGFFTMDGSPLDPGMYDWTVLEGIIIDSVTEDISIIITFGLKTPEQYTVSLDTSLGSASVTPTTILLGTSLNATITPPTGYNVTITKATVNGNLVPMNVSGNLVAINGSYITGNIVLYGNLTKIPTSTTVTNKVANAHFTIGSTEYSTTATIPLNQSVVIQISPNTNYILDGDVKVTHGSLVLTANASNNYTVSIANVQNPIIITGKTNQSSYTVTASKNFATAIDTIEPNTVVAGSNNTIEISPKTNYILTGITDITEGGYSVINDSRVSYRKSGNNYIITFNNVLGNIVINGTAQQLLTYSVSLAGDLNRIETTLSPTSVRQNSTLEAVVTNSDGVFITEVSMGGTTLLESDYTLTQNNVTEAIIQIANVTGNVVITGCRSVRLITTDTLYKWYEREDSYAEVTPHQFHITGKRLRHLWGNSLRLSVAEGSSDEFKTYHYTLREADEIYPYDEIWAAIGPDSYNITMNERTATAELYYEGITKTMSGITQTANPKSVYGFIAKNLTTTVASEVNDQKITELFRNYLPNTTIRSDLGYSLIYKLTLQNIETEGGYGLPSGLTMLILDLTPIVIPTSNIPLYGSRETYKIEGISWGEVYYTYYKLSLNGGYFLNCDGTEGNYTTSNSLGIWILFFFFVNNNATSSDEFKATFTPPLYPDEDTETSPRAKTINMSVR